MRACVHTCVRLSIFGYHCQVVNVKELVLKVRHDAARERRGLVLLLRPGYYSGAQSRVVAPTCCACFYYIYQGEKAAERHGGQFEA